MRILFASSLALAVSALAPSHAVECRNPVACLQLSKDAAGNLKARIALAQMSAGGVLLIEKIEPGPPESLVVEWRDVSCGADRELMLYVNDVRFAIDAPCATGDRTFVVDDAAGIAAAWRDRGPNSLRLSSVGRDGAIAWARVRAGLGLASPSTRLIAAAGSLRGAFEVNASLAPGASTSPRISVPFRASEMPATIDVSSLDDGPHALCVSAGGQADCVTFVHDGEATLAIPKGLCDIEGGNCVLPNAGSASTTECASPAGTPVLLDGSASTGPITWFEWFENYGTPQQISLGTGAQVQVSLSLGVHTITLWVIGPLLETAIATVVKTVADTKAPVVRVTMNPAWLWPADHRMVDVLATPLIQEACSDVSIELLSVTSNEPDDAAGDTDGNTTGDIQGVTTGTDDRAFQLRAETGPVFGGRRYLVTYSATDGSGNRGIGRVAVSVLAPRKITPPVEPVDQPGISLHRPPGS